MALIGAMAAVSLCGWAGALEVRPEPAQDLALPEDRRPWTDKVDAGLLAEAFENGDTVDCMVTFREPSAVAGLSATGKRGEVRQAWIASTASALDREYSLLGARLVSRYRFVPVARMTVPARFLPTLAGDRRVEALTPIRRVRALRAEGKALINATAVHTQGFTGDGVGVAILDTGVDYSHNELAPAGFKTIKLIDAINGDDDPMDDEGHGTSCAGIAAGTGGGVAPGARIIAAKVLDSEGNGDSSQVMDGLDAILASVAGGNPHNIRAASLSFGGYVEDAWPPFAGDCDDLSPDFHQAFQALLDAGVVVVVAAGNGGCTDGVAWPACVSNALVVGAVFDANLGSRSYSSLHCGSGACSDPGTSADAVACFSDSGERLDVWAPADCATTPTLGGVDEFCFTGTSAATPYVAGAVALLAQAVPGASATELRAALRATGKDVTDPRNGVTRKRIDVGAALAQLGGGCTAPAVPSGLAADRSFACTGQTIALTWTAVTGAASYSVDVATDPLFSGAQSFTASGPVFAYAPALQTPEIVYFRVRANAACGASSAASAAVQVGFNPQCGSPYGKVYYLSGIGHLRGVPPAFWYSDVAVFNPGDATAELRLSFSGNGTAPPAVTATLPGHQQVVWRDVLVALFGLAGEDVGAITVESSRPLQVTARTYSRITDPCDGKQKTYGQSYDGLEASQALSPGQVGYLVNLRSDTGYRTNVEFVNAGTVAANIEVRFFNNGGAPVGGPINRGVTPGQRVAVTAALPSGHSSAYAEVRVTSAGARVIGFASVIDAASTDPTTIAMLVAGAPTP